VEHVAQKQGTLFIRDVSFKS